MMLPNHRKNFDNLISFKKYFIRTAKLKYSYCGPIQFKVKLSLTANHTMYYIVTVLHIDIFSVT